MSATLLVALLEIPLDHAPNWDPARQILANFSEEELLAHRALPWSAQSSNPTAEELRAAASRGLDLLVGMWNDEYRHATRVTLSNACVLVFGGSSCGDEPFDGYADATFAIDLGLPEAAGFLS